MYVKPACCAKALADGTSVSIGGKDVTIGLAMIHATGNRTTPKSGLQVISLKRSSDKTEEGGKAGVGDEENKEKGGLKKKSKRH